LLLQAKADPNIKGLAGHTPLRRLALAILLKNNAQIAAKAADGCPLYLAAERTAQPSRTVETL
jgi:hypothetical protein